MKKNSNITCRWKPQIINYLSQNSCIYKICTINCTYKKWVNKVNSSMSSNIIAKRIICLFMCMTNWKWIVISKWTLLKIIIIIIIIIIIKISNSLYNNNNNNNNKSTYTWYNMIASGSGILSYSFMCVTNNWRRIIIPKRPLIIIIMVIY